jgi:hypothetical protein
VKVKETGGTFRFRLHNLDDDGFVEWATTTEKVASLCLR